MFGSGRTLSALAGGPPKADGMFGPYGPDVPAFLARQVCLIDLPRQFALAHWAKFAWLAPAPSLQNTAGWDFSKCFIFYIS